MSISPPLPPAITGLVLAGGQGSRMGGADKGLVEWRGGPLALHALQRLRPQVGTAAVNANRNLSVYQSWDVPVWPDADKTFPGPLAGLLAGLTQCRTEWLVTVPCDSPLFPEDLVARLSKAASEAGSTIAMACTDKPQPVFLLVHTSLRRHLASALAGGERKVRRWTDAHAPALAVFADGEAFGNANTADELAALPLPL